MGILLCTWNSAVHVYLHTKYMHNFSICSWRCRGQGRARSRWPGHRPWDCLARCCLWIFLFIALGSTCKLKRKVQSHGGRKCKLCFSGWLLQRGTAERNTLVLPANFSDARVWCWSVPLKWLIFYLQIIIEVQMHLQVHFLGEQNRNFSAVHTLFIGMAVA
jgi:hypothetical protein